GKKIICANNYPGIPNSDRLIWKQSRQAYEFFSRFRKTPVIGEIAWDIFDKLQEIKPFYPIRDLSAPTLQVRSTFALMKKKNWGEQLIESLAKNPLPIVSTFFIPAFMAEMWDYPGEIYCLGTDTDLSRAWVPLHPNLSRIKYLAPTERVVERLKMYGVRRENIILTGFPLPEELLGGPKKNILKKNLGRRLFNLLPLPVLRREYKARIIKHLGKENFIDKQHHPLTVMFAVGGAGAQKELAGQIMLGLKDALLRDRLTLILVAGIHNDVNSYFKKEISRLGLHSCLGKNIKIIFSANKDGYFHQFNRALADTDILWTKPSELSFYAALGLPIIMSEPLGCQEIFNQKWLRSIGAGVKQETPESAGQWLFSWLESGWFAEAAMRGYLSDSTDAVENIKKIISQ
ncbi:MAG: hypothetical protein V1763_00815, partial [Parcubacteria group bacterium]